MECEGRRWLPLIGGLMAGVFCLSSGVGTRAEPVGQGVKGEADQGLSIYAPVATVSGAVTIAGSDSMRPILTKLAAEFRQWHPDAKIAIQGEGSDLLQRFLSGVSLARRGDGNTEGHLGSQAVRMMAVSRELSKDEIAAFVERFGYKPIGMSVAQDAVAVYVHRDNPIKGLTLEQVDAMFSLSRKRGLPETLERWGQLGLTGEWEAAPVRLYGRDKRSTGTRPFFIEHVLQGGTFRPDLQEEPGSASVLVSISRDRYGIGYSSIGFQTAAVRAVPLAQKEATPFVEPTREAVARGNYPMSRRLYLYVNKRPDEQLLPIVLEFLKFVNTQRGQATVVAAGSYPISAAQAARNLQTLIGAQATLPLTAGREAR